MKKNRIKRDSKTLIFTALIDSNVWKAGDCIRVIKKDGYWQGTNNRTLEHFQMLWSHMHNENLMRLDMQWNYIC